MDSIAKYIKIDNTKKKGSERADAIKVIYDIYTSKDQIMQRKKQNWQRYCEWCRMNNKPGSDQAIKEFKKSKQFIRERNLATVCYFLSHIPTSDLYYIISIAKDSQARNLNFSSYLFGSIKIK